MSSPTSFFSKMLQLKQAFSCKPFAVQELSEESCRLWLHPGTFKGFKHTPTRLELNLIWDGCRIRGVIAFSNPTIFHPSSFLCHHSAMMPATHTMYTWPHVAMVEAPPLIASQPTMKWSIPVLALLGASAVAGIRPNKRNGKGGGSSQLGQFRSRTQSTTSEHTATSFWAQDMHGMRFESNCPRGCDTYMKFTAVDWCNVQKFARPAR